MLREMRIITARKIVFSFVLGTVLTMLTGFFSYPSTVGTPVPLPGGQVWNYGYPLVWYKTPMGIPEVTIQVPIHPLLGNMKNLLATSFAIDLLFWSCASFLLAGLVFHLRARSAH
jgi:hypothetical protein